MARRLPPLNALRAFEAAARHASLTLAAAELNVTHAAISRHVRELEAYLGVPLFQRTGRGIALSEAGRALARDLTPAFDALAAATEVYTGRQRKTRLVISAEVTFAACWLVPRLSRFSDANPRAEIVVDADNHLADLGRGEADIAIRYGLGPWPGLEAVPLVSAHCTAVGSPAYLKRSRITAVPDLARAILLLEDTRENWKPWLEAAGYSGPDPVLGPTLRGHLALQAAERGEGLVLADAVSAADAVAAGRLVRPFDVYVPALGHQLVMVSGRAQSRLVRAFRSWLGAELDAWRRKLDWPI